MQINHPFESSSSNEIRRSFCSSFCPARLSRPSTKSSSSDSSSPGEQVGAKKNNINITLFRTVGFHFHTRAWKVCKVLQLAPTGGTVRAGIGAQSQASQHTCCAGQIASIFFPPCIVKQPFQKRRNYFLQIILEECHLLERKTCVKGFPKCM